MNNLPRGGGVQISSNIKRERILLDKNGNQINNFKEQRIIKNKTDI